MATGNLKTKRVGEILVELGAIGAYEAQAGIEHAHLRGIPVGQALLELGLCDENTLRNALEMQPGSTVVGNGQIFLGAGPGIDHLVESYFDFR